MRRAGWKVWVADELDGSYEQVPPNLLAELQRDRRWCHGNLQNSRLMFEPGLHAVHRTAFLTGVLAYASSPLWLAFLLLSTLLFAQHARQRPDLFLRAVPAVPDLADRQPQADADAVRPDRACCCSRPRCSRCVAIVVRGEARRFGGAARLLASALIEFVHSLLLAPVRMLFHTQFVLAALTGWRLDWKSPPRDDASTGLARSACARHGVHTVLALAWIAAIVASSDGVPVVAVADPRSACCRRSRSRSGRSRVRDRPRPAPPRPAADAGGEPRAARCSREARAPAAAVAARLATLRAAVVDRGRAAARRRGAAAARRAGGAKAAAEARAHRAGAARRARRARRPTSACACSRAARRSARCAREVVAASRPSRLVAGARRASPRRVPTAPMPPGTIGRCRDGAERELATEPL